MYYAEKSEENKKECTSYSSVDIIVHKNLQ